MRIELSDAEIKILSRELIWGRLFALLVSMAFTLVVLFLIATKPENDIFIKLLISVCGIFSSSFVWWLANRNVNLDLRNRELILMSKSK